VCAVEEPAGSVDTVVDFGIIHHMLDWQQAISEIARVLRPGGLVLFEEIRGFGAGLARHGLHGTGRIEHHFGAMVFVGAARKA
jgi:SAM-dependent methyltransferase